MSYFGQRAESGSGVSPLNEQSRHGSATMLNGATKAEEEDEDEERGGGASKRTLKRILTELVSLLHFAKFA